MNLELERSNYTAGSRPSGLGHVAGSTAWFPCLFLALQQARKCRPEEKAPGIPQPSCHRAVPCGAIQALSSYQRGSKVILQGVREGRPETCCYEKLSRKCLAAILSSKILNLKAANANVRAAASLLCRFFKISVMYR